MDARLPFATGADRLRLLYQLPLTGHEKQILVMGDHEDATAAFDVELRHAELRIVAIGAAVPLPAVFDAVALPGTLLDGRQARGSDQRPRDLLNIALGALRPGGVVVGHLDHVLSLHGLRQLARGGAGLSAAVRSAGFTSAAACQRTLTHLGFAEPESFYVEPRITAPMALIPSDPLAARSHFLRAVRRSRSLYTAPGFGLRMALAALCLGGTLQPQVFFWARRPC